MKDGIQGPTTNGLVRWTIRSRREHQDQQGTGDGGSSMLILKTGTEGLDWNGGVSRVLKIAADKDGPPPGTAFAGGHWKSSSKVFSSIKKKEKDGNLAGNGSQRWGRWVEPAPITTVPVVGSRPSWSFWQEKPTAIQSNPSNPNASRSPHRCDSAGAGRTCLGASCGRSSQRTMGSWTMDGFCISAKPSPALAAVYTFQSGCMLHAAAKADPNATTRSPWFAPPAPSMTQTRRPLSPPCL